LNGGQPLAYSKGQVAAISFLRPTKYTEIVDVDIRFSQSAFKHGVSEADIRTAFDNALYDERLDDSDGEEEINARYGPAYGL
jgi:predicted hydrolase (HD superfamily)